VLALRKSVHNDNACTFNRAIINYGYSVLARQVTRCGHDENTVSSYFSSSGVRNDHDL